MSRSGVGAFCGLTLLMNIHARTQFRAAILDLMRCRCICTEVGPRFLRATGSKIPSTLSDSHEISPCRRPQRTGSKID